MRIGFLLVFAALLATGGCPSSDQTDDPGKSASTRQAAAPHATRLDAAEELVDSTDYPGRIHVVETGDTLFSLAERYYGSGNQWRKILSANKRRLTNPRDLPVGMKLIIP